MFHLIKRLLSDLLGLLEFIYAHISVWFYCVTFFLIKLVEVYIPKFFLNRSPFLRLKREHRNISPPHALYADPSYGRHRYLKAGGNKYHYIESGSSKNTLLLCLHDFGDFWYGFRHQLGALKSNFWIVAPDLKGFGDSDKPLQVEEYKMEVIVTELLQLIMSLKKERLFILSHGLGSYVAWHFVSAFPDMIEGYISIDGPHPKALCSSIGRSWTALDRFKWLYTYRLPYIPEHELMLEDEASYDKGLSQTDREAYQYAFSRKGDWTGGLNYYRNFPLYLCHLRKRVEKKESPLPIRVLFISGDGQSKVDFEQICRSSKFVDKFSVQIVENAERNPHQTQPDIVNNFIKEFVAGTKEVQKDKTVPVHEKGFDKSNSPPLFESILTKVLGLSHLSTEQVYSKELTSYSTPISHK